MTIEWNEHKKCFDVAPGICPYPVKGCNGTARDCVQKGQCGCDEAAKPENQDTK